MSSFLQKTSEGVILQLQVLPRSSKNQIVGLQGETLKLKLTSPPVDGAANKCCCEFLAKLFGVAKSRVLIIGGKRSRKKRVLVKGINLKEAFSIIESSTP